MKIIDLKYQSATPADPSPNTLGVYADSGTAGVVYTLTSGGVPTQLGIRFTGSVPGSNVATGRGVLETGIVYGATGVGSARITGLGNPYLWVPIFASNGATLAVPAYTLVNTAP